LPPIEAIYSADNIETILSQTEQKLQGSKSIPERIVLFYDSHVRPICKGKLNKRSSFGRTLQLVQDSSGVILHYEVRRAHKATHRYSHPQNSFAAIWLCA
jgi:hypothetical protein